MLVTTGYANYTCLLKGGFSRHKMKGKNRNFSYLSRFRMTSRERVRFKNYLGDYIDDIDCPTLMT